METNNKHLLYAGLAIIVVIAIALVIPHLHKTAATTAVAPVSSTVPSSQTPATTGVTMSTADWNALFSKYDGKLVVFAADCTATPIVQDQSKDATIVLANNSAVPHAVTIENNTYTIGAYHYKPVVLTVSGTNTIKCDTRGDAANINVKQ